MKVTINVECTPEEARRYMGLPDVTQFNEHLMRTMAEQMTGMGSQDFMTNWQTMIENTANFWTGQFNPVKPR